MKKIALVFYNIACAISFMVGILHFAAPYATKWFSYIPHAPVEIYQVINYINFCFSLLLAGFSLVLLIVQKQLFAGLKELKAFYTFFVLVWLSRIVIQVVWPWPSGLQKWLVVAFITQFIFTLIPLIYFHLIQIQKNEKKISNERSYGARRV